MSTTRQIPCSILATPLRGMEALDSFNSNVATSRQGRWQLRSLSRTLEHTHTEYFWCDVDGASLDCVQDKVQMRRPGPSPASPSDPPESPSQLQPFLPAPLSNACPHRAAKQQLRTPGAADNECDKLSKMGGCESNVRRKGTLCGRRGTKRVRRRGVIVMSSSRRMMANIR